MTSRSDVSTIPGATSCMHSHLSLSPPPRSACLRCLGRSLVLSLSVSKTQSFPFLFLYKQGRLDAARQTGEDAASSVAVPLDFYRKHVSQLTLYSHFATCGAGRAAVGSHPPASLSLGSSFVCTTPSSADLRTRRSWNSKGRPWMVQSSRCSPHVQRVQGIACSRC